MSTGLRRRSVLGDSGRRSGPMMTPMVDATAQSCIAAFNRTVLQHHEAPVRILSDRGKNLIAAIWQAMSEYYNVKLTATPSFTPEANGTCEVSHKRIVSAIIAMAHDSKTKWPEALPMIQHNYNTTKVAGIDEAPFTVVFGHTARRWTRVMPMKEVFITKGLSRRALK